MITEARMEEMSRKFAEFGELVKETTVSVPGFTPTKAGVMKLAVTMPEKLVALRIAQTKEEAQEFLSMVIIGRLMVSATSNEDPFHGIYDLMKFGFQLGLAVGKKEEVA